MCVCVCVCVCIIDRFPNLEWHITHFYGNCHGVTGKVYRYCLSRDIHFPDITSRQIIPHYDAEWQQLCKDWPSPSFSITTILNIPTTTSEVSKFSTIKATLYIYIYIYIYMCVCVCVCVCVCSCPDKILAIIRFVLPQTESHDQASTPFLGVPGSIATIKQIKILCSS